MTLRPFFTYYGGKWRTALSYYKPTQSTIVEPFAGAAGYSLRHFHKQVILVEAFDKVAALWAYLIRVRQREIMSIPLDVSHVDELRVPEQRYLVGFWLNKGTASPCNVPSAWMRSGDRPHSFWGETIRGIVAHQVQFIRHWKIIHGNYTAAPDIRATWFIDPPYMGNDGGHYRRKVPDYSRLGTWCRGREGRVIVCEQEGAEWLPFRRHEISRANGSHSRSDECREVVWINNTVKP